jgi:hypothetical protein
MGKAKLECNVPLESGVHIYSVTVCEFSSIECNYVKYLQDLVKKVEYKSCISWECSRLSNMDMPLTDMKDFLSKKSTILGIFLLY